MRKAKKKVARRASAKAKTAEAQDVFTDPTVLAVMVGNQWHPVRPGSWTVDLRGPYLHAAWLDGTDGTRFSAFISKVQMVKHASLPAAARAPRRRT